MLILYSNRILLTTYYDSWYKTTILYHLKKWCNPTHNTFLPTPIRGLKTSQNPLSPPYTYFNTTQLAAPFLPLIHDHDATQPTTPFLSPPYLTITQPSSYPKLWSSFPSASPTESTSHSWQKRPWWTSRGGWCRRLRCRCCPWSACGGTDPGPVCRGSSAGR